MDKEWTKVLDIIKNEVNSGNFRTWFAKTAVDETFDGILMIRVPNTFIKDNLAKKFLPILQSATQQVFGKHIPIDFKVDHTLDSKLIPDQNPEFNLSPQTIIPSRPGLNPKYTLNNFVVGLSNNLAYAAAQAVVQNPGLSYNPLFIYGGTGVGKTHLMLGIGNSLLSKNPYLKIIYCPLEKFMNDFIQSIQSKRMGDFRARYRNCDLILVDDVQFLSGRDSTQEEFFHTFNDLQAKNSQIILTSDRPPNEIQRLESRLASRFQGGLMVDIQQPDFDTRVAILKAKCLERGETIEGGLLTLIAENMPTNARELEGKLIRIIQTKSTGQPLNEQMILKILGQSHLNPEGQKPDFRKVLSSINQYFGIKMGDLTGPRRKKELVLPRQIAMFILYCDCKLPYERIGELLGGRDHTTIMHGVDKIKEANGRDREIQRMMIEIKQNLVSSFPQNR